MLVGSFDGVQQYPLFRNDLEALMPMLSNASSESKDVVETFTSLQAFVGIESGDTDTQDRVPVESDPSTWVDLGADDLTAMQLRVMITEAQEKLSKSNKIRDAGIIRHCDDSLEKLRNHVNEAVVDPKEFLEHLWLLQHWAEDSQQHEKLRDQESKLDQEKLYSRIYFLKIRMPWFDLPAAPARSTGAHEAVACVLEQDGCTQVPAYPPPPPRTDRRPLRARNSKAGELFRSNSPVSIATTIFD